MPVDVRDLAGFGRPTRLRWMKRRWRCREPRCAAQTWTETSEHLDAQVVLTRRAGVEACCRVGDNARPVSQLADELGVCWRTAMSAVIEHGVPLVDDLTASVSYVSWASTRRRSSPPHRRMRRCTRPA
jgi:transposase